jgi:hypothetical protein
MGQNDPSARLTTVWNWRNSKEVPLGLGADNAAEKHAIEMIESDRKWRDFSVSTDYRSAVVPARDDTEGPEHPAQREDDP